MKEDQLLGMRMSGTQRTVRSCSLSSLLLSHQGWVLATARARDTALVHPGSPTAAGPHPCSGSPRTPQRALGEETLEGSLSHRS